MNSTPWLIENSNYALFLPYYWLKPNFYLKLHFTSIYLLFLIDFAHSLPSQSINKAWASNAKSTWSETNRSNLTQLWKNSHKKHINWF